MQLRRAGEGRRAFNFGEGLVTYQRGVDGGGEAAEYAYQDERKGTTSPQGPTQLVRLDMFMFTLISIGI
jgi:hypothetical protein